MLKQFPLYICKANAADWFEILNLDITDGGPAIVIS